MITFLIPALLAAACAAAALLVWALRLRRALRKSRAENEQLRQMLLAGSRSAQEELESLRRLRHDLRHYLRVAGAAPPDGTAGETPATALSGRGGECWALAALEQYYRGQGERLGFDTDLRLDLRLSREEMLPDVCLVVSNLLENALEALQREGGGWMRARGTWASGYLSLVVSNSSSQPLRSRNGRYLSSKGAGRTGVGLATVQDIVRRYGGSCGFSADGVQFRAAVFLPCRQPSGRGPDGPRDPSPA